MHPLMAPTLDRGRSSHSRHPADGARRAARRPPALADDRAGDAEGLDRPEGRRRPARSKGTFRVAPGSAHRAAHESRALAHARGVAAQLSARGAVRRRRRAAAGARGARADGRAADGRESARQRRRCCCRDLRLPDFRTLRRRRRRAGRRRGRGHARPRPLPARRRRAERRRSATSASSARTRRCRTGSTPCSRPPPASGMAETIAGRRVARAATAACIEVLSEHQCQGWLEGYLLTGRHGLFNTYEAFVHIVDSMFNQHAKWLKVTRELPWRRPIASLNYLLVEPRLAAGPQRLHAPGSGLHRSRAEQEAGDRARLPAAGRELPAERDGPLPAQPALHQHRRRREARRRRSGSHGRRGRGTARPASAAGLGQQRRRRRARRRHGGGRRRADARDAGGGDDPATRTARR